MENVRRTALIIEDDTGLYTLLESILGLRGVFSIRADTVSKAKSLSDKIHPAFIFVDNQLPDGYGFNCIALLRKNFPEAFIVAMTSEATEKIKTKTQCDGANCFLQKPFMLKEITGLLKE